MKAEETFDYPIRWLWHGIQRQYNKIAAKHDLSMTMGYVLLNIDTEKGTPSTQLGPKIGMEASSLTRTLKSMETKGYIYKEVDNEDRRIVYILLTKLGKTKRKISRQAVYRFNEHLESKVSIAQKKCFFEVLEVMNNSINNHNIFEEQLEYDKAKN